MPQTLRVGKKVVVLQAEISQESGMTFRKSARWPIVSVRLTSCILRQTLRVEIGMREHRQQDSLDFHPFLLCLNDCDAILHFVVCPPYYANHQFDFADAWQIVSHPQEFVELLLVLVFWFGFDFAILFRHSQDGIQLEYRQSGKVTFRSLMTGLVNGDKPNIDVVFQC